jgi:hypothetical protein
MWTTPLSNSHLFLTRVSNNLWIIAINLSQLIASRSQSSLYNKAIVSSREVERGAHGEIDSVETWCREAQEENRRRAVCNLRGRLSMKSWCRSSLNRLLKSNLPESSSILSSAKRPSTLRNCNYSRRKSLPRRYRESFVPIYFIRESNNSRS